MQQAEWARYLARHHGETHIRIPIAEDDATLADGLTRSPRQAGYAVDQASDGATADAVLSAQTAQTYSFLILDVGLPRMLGLEVLKRLRSRGAMLPMLILTAADSVEERVKGLDLGVDDYVAKPLTLSELKAHAHVLVRRGAGGGTTLVRHGPLAFNQVGRIAYIHDQVVELSTCEIGLLEVLLARVGRLVSKEQLVNHLCGWGEEVSNNAIEVYIRRLRKRIKVKSIRITTVYGLGYCLEHMATPMITAAAHGWSTGLTAASGSRVALRACRCGARDRRPR